MYFQVLLSVFSMNVKFCGMENEYNGITEGKGIGPSRLPTVGSVISRVVPLGTLPSVRSDILVK